MNQYSSDAATPQDINTANDNRSVTSKFTYQDYPPVKPINPIYQSTGSLKIGTLPNAKNSKVFTIQKHAKYDPLGPKRITDWRWFGALCVLLFFPTGLIALGLAIKAQRKFQDGFIDQSKKLNKRAFIFCLISSVFAAGWILGLFFGTDKWPRTNG